MEGVGGCQDGRETGLHKLPPVGSYKPGKDELNSFFTEGNNESIEEPQRGRLGAIKHKTEGFKKNTESDFYLKRNVCMRDRNGDRERHETDRDRETES